MWDFKIKQGSAVINFEHPEHNFMQGFSGTIELYFADEFGLCKEDANKKSLSFSLINDATFIIYK